MKKGILALAMILVLGLTANVALTVETVTFPYWQEGFGSKTFFSVSNVSETEDAIVTINLMNTTGALLQSTVGTVAPGTAWLPDTSAAWFLPEQGLGFGNFVVTGVTDDVVYLWGCVYGPNSPSGVAGFTLVLPQNPYGME